MKKNLKNTKLINIKLNKKNEKEKIVLIIIRKMTKYDIELIIFDLDGTLIDHKNDDIYVYNFVNPLIEYLVSKNIKLALASYNTNAYNILKEMNIIEHFEIIEYRHWQVKFDHKQEMLENIVNKMNIPTYKILFIDDQWRFLYTAQKIGINTSLICTENIKECLKQYIDLSDLNI